MEVYDRIKDLRKKSLKMSQTAFGKSLGVNRDVINNIENNRLARPEQKMSLYKLICSEFNVNEDWLLNGNEPMFVESKDEYSALIDKVLSGENEFAKNVFKTFAKFDIKDWQALEQLIDKFNATASQEDAAALAVQYDIPDIDAEVASYRQQLEAQKKAADESSAMNGGLGIG